MDEERRRRIAGQLTREAAELDEQIQAYERQQRESLKDSVHELSSYDNHPADLGNETFERSKDLALLNNARQLRHQVREALSRLDDGTYGYCKRCGAEIDPDRLSALPYVLQCLACQKDEEERDPPRWRPIEEEVMSPPFGRSFRDGRSVHYDGEDVWQDVARYGTSESPSDLGGAESYDDIYIDSDERRGLVQPVERALSDLEGNESLNP